MPTILRHGPYRFFFYSADRHEPAHGPVEHDERRAKFWLRPIRLQVSGGFSRVELGRIQAIVAERLEALLEAWDDFFID